MGASSSGERASAPGALAGLRVLDLGRVLAAPLASQWLADLGADVIKVERPGAGDEARSYGPPFLRDREGNPTDTAAFYLSCNRNKRSITVDHAKPEGRALLRRLAAESDVLIENFRSGALAKYGLDYPSLAALNPRLVYCSITGFGQNGANATRPGYDGIFQAMGGFMSCSGYPNEPIKVGISIVDILCSLFAGVAILAALRHRDQVSGRGQHIDLALVDCGIASLSHFAMNYLVSGETQERRGNGGFGGVPSQAFRCRDAGIFVVAGNDKQFRALCATGAREELPRDPRFATVAARIENRVALLRELDAMFALRPRAEWQALLDAADVPAGPVRELSEVFADPDFRARGIVVEAQHPQAGALPLLANPMRLGETPIERYAAPPLIGEHTEAVLRERLGLDAAAIADLRRAGAI